MGVADEVIDVRHDFEGGIRITLDNPYGSGEFFSSHRRLVAVCPDRKYTSHGYHNRINAGQQVTAEHFEGDDASESEMFIAGATQFVVPAGSTEIKFDDGSVYAIPGDDVDGAPDTVGTPHAQLADGTSRPSWDPANNPEPAPEPAPAE